MTLATLEIVIPTFNRAQSLRRLSESVLPHLSQDVRLLIIDNASTDDTAQVCTNLAGTSKYLRIIRNRANVGGVANMLRCIELSEALYCWLLGDDERIVTEKLPSLCAFLAADRADAVHICPNAEYLALQLKSDKWLFRSENELVREFYSLAALQFMSSNILKCEFARAHLHAAYRLTHLQHAYILPAYRSTVCGRGLAVFPQNLIESRQRRAVQRWTYYPAVVDAKETLAKIASDNCRRRLMAREFSEHQLSITTGVVSGLLSRPNIGLNLRDTFRLYGLLPFHRWYFPTLVTLAIFARRLMILRSLMALAILLAAILWYRPSRPGQLGEKFDIEAATYRALLAGIYRRLSAFRRCSRSVPFKN